MRRGQRKRAMCCAICVMTTCVAAVATGVSAETYTVTRTDDPVIDGCDVDGCSLREAIIAANGNPGADTVSLPTPGTYTLAIAGAGEDLCQTGDLDILDNVDIVGIGARHTLISAAGLDRVVQIHIGVSAVTIFGVTIRDGSLTGVSGAGIHNGGGTLTIDACAILDNSSSATGAGVFQPIGRTLVAIDTTFSGNESTNAAGDSIGNTQGTVELTNCTFRAVGAFDEPIINNLGTMQVTNCTLVNEAGGITMHASGADITVTNTVVEGECLTTAMGAFVSGGGNLESPGDTCGFGEPSDVVSVPDPELEAFGQHGGYTDTYAPAGGTSPVVDTALGGPCPATDQRCVERPIDGDGDLTPTCDRGSVEYEPPMFADDFETGDTTAWAFWTPG